MVPGPILGMSGKSTRQFLPCWIGFPMEVFITLLSYNGSDTGRNTFYIPGRCAEVWMGPEFDWSGRVRDLKFPKICIWGDLGGIRRLGWWLNLENRGWTGSPVRADRSVSSSEYDSCSGELKWIHQRSTYQKIVWKTSKIPQIWDSPSPYLLYQ